MNRINQFLNALDRQNMGKVGKPMESDAELFEQLVSMACPPKPRRRRVQTAKKVEQASRLPDSGSKRDACSTFLEELIDACVLAANEVQIISEGNRAKPGSLYFPSEALEKDLQFITDTAVCLEKTIGLESEKAIREFIDHCTARNLGEKLNRLSACGDAQAGLESSSLSACDAQAGPDLFAVIKREGKV